MRVKRVVVKGLFGLFDHTVPLNMKDRITIVHGPNGFGKTFLLRLVKAMLKGEWETLRSAPYRSLSVEFDSGETLGARRSGSGRCTKATARSREFEFAISYKAKRSGRARLLKVPVAASSERTRRLVRYVPYVRALGEDLWLDRRRGDTIRTYEVVRRYRRYIPGRPDLFPAPPAAVSKIWDRAQVHLVEAQRLLHQERDHGAGREEGALRPAVSEHARQLARLLTRVQSSYASMSQSLDRTFPSRLLRTTRPKYAAQTIRSKLSLLETRRRGLEELGLLDVAAEEDRPRATDKRLTTDVKRVLSVFVDDTERKLDVFNDTAQRISLLMRIVNSRFLYKKMRVDRENGFVFTSHDGTTLEPEKLSSGEQHELVLLYQLLFAVNPGTLVLIDEPELSQHVGWQRKFLGDLQEMAQVSDFDVLIATHSPMVIHDRWDLAVDLKGPEL